ncbi:hypothetical protein M3Y99_00965500 [Aphelenchoides fujianensis]|nr:hypothetical protein M3Y99_00965500 [Aphelenchoides fujianensis]
MKDPKIFVEEVHLGGDLWKEVALFSPTNTSLAITSNTTVIVYEVKTGHRRILLSHSERICGLKWGDDNALSTISTGGQVSAWNLETAELTSQTALSTTAALQWVYNVGSSLPSSSSFRLDLEAGSTTVCAKLPVVIKERRKLACSEKYAVFCDGISVRLLPFEDVSINGSLEFKFKQMFNTNAEAKEWRRLRVDHRRSRTTKCASRSGLNPSAKAFFHAHPAEVCIAVTPLLSVFCGTTNCRVDRWSIATSGGGRYQQRDGIEQTDAPVEALWLSADSNFLLVVLGDNSMVVLNSALAVVSRPHTMQWPAAVKPVDWIGLYVDNANPDYVVTNTRFGYIQWMDPVKWRTVTELDIVGENVPPRDSIALPKFNWANVYAITTSATLLVTAECRREDRNATALRFFNRVKPGCMNDMRLMDVIRIPQRVRFLRCNLEEVRQAGTTDVFFQQYVVIVDESGLISTYEFDPLRANKWHLDLKRVVDWQRTEIADCSTIRANTMATVNVLAGDSEHSSVALLWNMEVGSLTGFVDQIPNVRHVRWAPDQDGRELTLLIAGAEMLAAYDFTKNQFKWAVAEPNLRLFTNPFAAVAYRDHSAFILNHRDGSVLRELEFSSDQSEVVATGSAANLRLSGLNEEGLSLLKLDTDENSTLRDITSLTKNTPFSVLARQARSDATPAAVSLAAQLSTVRVLSARKLLEGSAHTLAPLNVLAGSFIRSCLLPRQVQS